jgi:ABC-type polar amino acid transport system ATPase subunit
MIVVTHEMGFARSVADAVCFMGEGRILESAPPGEFFAAPKNRKDPGVPVADPVLL